MNREPLALAALLLLPASNPEYLLHIPRYIYRQIRGLDHFGVGASLNVLFVEWGSYAETSFNDSGRSLIAALR